MWSIKSPEKICSNCVMDDTVPDIHFDDKGKCNYCYHYEELENDYPRGSQGLLEFKRYLLDIKRSGKNQEYDCVIGLSGGTDSTYLIYMMKRLGLRPLAVNLDNGWHSEIAVNNIKNCLDELQVDLRTHVIDWEEIRKIHGSFLKANLPWPDGVTDIAIKSALFKIAAEENIRHVLIGQDFRTEGRQPTEWTYIDGHMIKHLSSKIGGINLKTFPNLTVFDLFYYVIIKRIKLLKPFWYLPYDKAKARALIEKRLGWRYYGGHHHESLFTKFIISYWLPRKFGIDKRKVTFSALIRSGELSRESALERLDGPPYDVDEMEEDKDYFIKKLGLTQETFQPIWDDENRKFSDFPSYYPLYLLLQRIIDKVFSYIFPAKKMITYRINKK